MYGQGVHSFHASKESRLTGDIAHLKVVLNRQRTLVAHHVILALIAIIGDLPSTTIVDGCSRFERFARFVRLAHYL